MPLEQEQPESDTRGVRIAADVGGTFTDLVVIDAQGTVRREKSLSTPPNFEKCVLETITNVLAKHRLDPASVRAVNHGTGLIPKRGTLLALKNSEFSR